MAQGNGGSFTLTGSQNFSVRIFWSETYSETDNTHVVKITRCELLSHNWYGFTYYPSGTISIDGITHLGKTGHADAPDSRKNAPCFFGNAP